MLVIGRIGKDISGTGLDCNVVGRYTAPFASGGPAITRLVALDTTPATGGNVNGIGVVDVTTRRLFDKLSFAETYPNALTSTATTAVKIPMVMANDRLATLAAEVDARPEAQVTGPPQPLPFSAAGRLKL